MASRNTQAHHSSSSCCQQCRCLSRTSTTAAAHHSPCLLSSGTQLLCQTESGSMSTQLQGAGVQRVQLSGSHHSWGTLGGWGTGRKGANGQGHTRKSFWTTWGLNKHSITMFGPQWGRGYFSPCSEIPQCFIVFKSKTLHEGRKKKSTFKISEK